MRTSANFFIDDLSFARSVIRRPAGERIPTRSVSEGKLLSSLTLPLSSLTLPLSSLTLPLSLLTLPLSSLTLRVGMVFLAGCLTSRPSGRRNDNECSLNSGQVSLEIFHRDGQLSFG